LVGCGVMGGMVIFKPVLSWIIWTTMATGLPPEEHHIGHFVAVNEKTGEQLPVTSQMRKVKALWNILSGAGRTVDVVGWWATWPAETVKGSMVSDHFAYHFLFEGGLHPDADPTGKTYPPALVKTLAPDVKRPQDLTAADLAPYIHVSAEELARPFDLNDDLSEFRWALSTALTYEKVGLDLWKRDQPQNLFVYFEGVDSTSHLFGHL